MKRFPAANDSCTVAMWPFVRLLWPLVNKLVACLVVTEQWAPEDTSTPIKPDSRKAAAGSASRTLDDADRSLAAAGIYLITCFILHLHIYIHFCIFIWLVYSLYIYAPLKLRPYGAIQMCILLLLLLLYVCITHCFWAACCSLYTVMSVMQVLSI